MKELKISIVESLDGSSSVELYPYLPYILQDIEEIGTDPRLVEKLIRTHIGSQNLKVLDLGSGKGAVSIHLARELGCVVTGIDGMPAFIEAAMNAANREKVAHLCTFLLGDIREKIYEYTDFDVVILGAIGPVLGFIGDTLNTLRACLKPNGYVIIDDGFKEDNTWPMYDSVVSRSAFYSQIKQAGFIISEEIILPASALYESNRHIQSAIVKRAEELASQFPEKQNIFTEYIQAQEDEIEKLENHLVVGMWLLQKTNNKI